MSDLQNQQVQPMSLGYERAALALATRDGKVARRVFTELSRQVFASKVHRIVWDTGKELFDQGRPVTQLTLQEALDTKQLTLSSPLSKVLRLKKSERGLADNFSHVILKLREKQSLRALIDISSDTAAAVLREKEPRPGEILTGLLEQAYQLDRRMQHLLGDPDARLFFGRNYVKRRTEHLRRKRRMKKVGLGFPALDRLLTYGMVPGTLSVLAGRPSMGKSAVKLNFIKNLCSRGVGVLSLTPEMGIDQDGERLDALISDLTLRELAKYRRWDEDDPRHSILREAIKEQARWPLFTYPGRRVSVATVISQLRQLRQRGAPVDVVFIDLFDRLQDVQVNQGKHIEIGRVLNELSRVAQEFQVHICSLVQIHRLGKQSNAQKYRPTIEDVKDSGAFEEYADLMFVLWREGFYNKSVEDDRLEIGLVKQRGGIGGNHVWVPFLWLKQWTRIVSLTEDDAHGAQQPTTVKD